MQCPICKAEWSLSKSKSQQLITKCPFCGENLVSTVKEQKEADITNVLRSLVQTYGKELYAEESSQRFKALLADVAANFQKERKLLNIAIVERIPAKLLAWNDKSDDDKQMILFNCKLSLVDEYSIIEESAIEVINMLAFGLGWNMQLEIQSHTRTAQNEMLLSQSEKNDILSNDRNQISHREAIEHRVFHYGFIQVEEIEETLLIILEGDMNFESSVEFEQILSHIACGNNINAIFDCSRVTYLNSTAIGLFVACRKLCMGYGGEIALMNPSNEVYSVLKLLDFAHYFLTADGKAEAIELLRPFKRTSFFPKLFKCPICKVKSKAIKPGRYRCKSCLRILTVTANGTVYES